MYKSQLTLAKSSSIQFLIRVYPCKRGWPDWHHSNINLSNSHSPSRSIHGILLFQTNTLALLHFFYVFFGCPCFLLLFTSNSNTFLKICPSSLLNTCPYLLTHSSLPSEPLFPASIPTSPLGPLPFWPQSERLDQLIAKSFGTTVPW